MHIIIEFRFIHDFVPHFPQWKKPISNYPNYSQPNESRLNPKFGQWGSQSTIRFNRYQYIILNVRNGNMHNFTYENCVGHAENAPPQWASVRILQWAEHEFQRITLFAFIFKLKKIKRASEHKRCTGTANCRVTKGKNWCFILQNSCFPNNFQLSLSDTETTTERRIKKTFKTVSMWR